MIHDTEYYDEDDMVEREPILYSIATYLIDKVYGGPEEGGWWYTAGYIAVGNDIPLPVIVKTYEEAREAAEKMNEAIAPLNVGRRDISSVLSDGIYSVEINEVFEGEAVVPNYFPQQRPHYE